MRRIMEIICEYSPIRIKKREKGEFLAGMEIIKPCQFWEWQGLGCLWGCLLLFGVGD